MTKRNKEIKEIFIYISILLLFSFLIVVYRSILEINYIGAEGFLKQDYGKPFINRALIIWIVKWIKNITNIMPSKIFIMFEILAFFLSGWVFSTYINTFINNITVSRVLSFSLYFIVVFELILPRYQPLWYPYDAYSLLFFLVGLLLIRKKIYNHWFYILFIVATFNRETTLFLTIVILFTAWEYMPKKNYSHIYQLRYLYGLQLKCF